MDEEEDGEVMGKGVSQEGRGNGVCHLFFLQNGFVSLVAKKGKNLFHLIGRCQRKKSRIKVDPKQKRADTRIDGRDDVATQGCMNVRTDTKAPDARVHNGRKQPRIQTEVLGHSLVRSLVRSHRSLVRSLTSLTPSLVGK